MTDVWEGLDVRTERPLRPVPDQAEQRLPPQDTAAEKAVLGALILRPDLTPAIDAIIRDDDWYRPAHRLIWDTITERHSNGQAVDTLTLAAAIGTARELAGNGGPLYLSELANDPNVLPDQATWHARIVAARGHERRTVELGTWLTQAGHGGADDEKIQQRIDLHTAQRARTGTTPTSTWAHVDLTDALAGTGPDDTPTLMPRSDGPCLLYPGAVHVLSGEPTSGKAQPYTSQVQTPTGPRLMGDLVVGDVILATDGGPQTVEAVYERGELEVWEVATSDGTVIEACGEHLWTVQDHNDHQRGNTWRTLTTEAIAGSLRTRAGRRRWHLPTVAASHLVPIGDLPVDPYLLGLLLGDGCLVRGVVFDSGDEELHQAAVALLPDGMTATRHGIAARFVTPRGQTNPLLNDLRALDLIGSTSATKHIPPAYLTASAGNRLALLQGLLDTDGGLERRIVTYASVSTQLVSAVVHLVRSLGGFASTSWRITRHQNGPGQRSARVSIHLPPDLEPFRLTRKADDYRAHAGRRVHRLSIVDARPTGRRAPMRCIAVSSPDRLYLTDGHVPTHNTWLALHAIRHELAQDRDVAFIDFEDRAIRVVARLLLIGAHPDHIRKHFRYARPEIALDTAGRAALAATVTGTTLTVIDGVTEAMTLHGLDLSSNPDVATFYALLPRWIASHDTTVVLIDHVVKDGERQGRWSIGGQHKVAGIDGAAYTVKAVEPFGRGKRGTARIFIAKDRHGHVEEHALGRCAAEFHLDSTDPNVSVATLDPPEAMPTTEGGDLRPTHLMERVSRYLEIHPGETTTQVGEAKLGKVVYVRQALTQLVAEGHVEVRPGPRNASHHHVIEPFRRDGETPNDHWS